MKSKLIPAFCSFYLLCIINFCYAQEAELRFVGYDNQNPVFSISYPNENENFDQDSNSLSSEVATEKVTNNLDGIVAEAPSKKLKLVVLSEHNGETNIISADTDVDKVLTYLNGTYIAVSKYGELGMVAEELFRELKFQEDTFDDSDFKEQVIEKYDSQNILNIFFASNGKKLIYPEFSRLNLRIYDLNKNEYSEVDLSKVDAFGGSILMPFESSEHIYFLFTGRGPYELFQLNKESQNLKEAPFTLGRRGDFGLKYHPEKEQLLFIYEDIPFAYHFGLNKFQKINFPANLELEKSEMGKHFQRIFYSKTENDWHYAILGDKKINPVSLNIDESESAFDLNWQDIENLVEQERLKNKSPSEELMMSLKKVVKITKPISAEFKDEIEKLLVAFDQKYEAQSSNPEVKKALITSQIVRLDTSLVSERAVSKSKTALIEMVKRDELNMNPMSGLQIMGRISTVQPPVHPAKVQVLQALVEDFISENTIDSNEKLDASGLGLLLIALKANEQYDKAIKYMNKQLKFINANDLYGKKEALESLIYLQLRADKFNDALNSIEVYRANLKNDSSDYLKNQIQSDIQKAYAYSGLKDYKRALNLLNDANESYFKSKGAIFGSETKIWLEYSLLSAFVELYHKTKLKSEKDYLNELLSFINENNVSIQYKSMYAGMIKLLKRIDEENRIQDLAEPK